MDSFAYLPCVRRVSKNSQRGGGCFGGLGAKPTAAGSTGAEPPALANFAFFGKYNLISELF